MPKILVTGGSGFVGQALLNNHYFRDARVIGRKKSSETHEFIETELNDEFDYRKVLEDVHTIVHLAGRAHVMKELSSHPLEEFKKINTYATLNLAKQASESEVKRFIFVSTIKVLGENTNGGKVFTEKDPLNPVDPYSISKAQAEVGLEKIANDSNMNFIIIRPPLVYGNGVKGNFNRLINLYSYSLPLPFGSINNKRSLVAVENLVDLIIQCIKNEKANNQKFLISDDHDLSTSDLLKNLYKLKGKKHLLFGFKEKNIKFLFRLLGRMEIYHRLFDSLQVDISFTKKQLNWEPSVSLFESLRKFKG